MHLYPILPIKTGAEAMFAFPIILMDVPLPLLVAKAALKAE